ncbi:MAG: hypothetical protein HYY17_04670 [Planctomycetes bacterium]|nr:hypothetical protein [Planctomycetota bacterium]
MKQVLWALTGLVALWGWSAPASAQDPERRMEELKKEFEKRRHEMEKKFEEAMRQLKEEFGRRMEDLKGGRGKKEKDCDKCDKKGEKKGCDKCEKKGDRKDCDKCEKKGDKRGGGGDRIEELFRHLLRRLEELEKRIEKFHKDGGRDRGGDRDYFFRFVPREFGPENWEREFRRFEKRFRGGDDDDDDRREFRFEWRGDDREGPRRPRRSGPDDY